MCGPRRASRGLATALLALLAAVAPAAAAAERVVAVEVRSDVPIDRPHDVLAAIAVRPGEALDEQAVARSLRNLNASGRAGEIEAYVEPAAGGVRLIFALRGRAVVRQVAFEGELGLPAAELRPVVEQAEGQPLVEDRVFRSVYRLQDRYLDRGYLDAAVRVRVDGEPQSNTATVTFRVDSGEPALIGSLIFDGDLGPFRPADLLAPLRGGPGERYRGAVGRSDAERLERWLIEQGHRAALVREPEIVYTPANHQVDLAYSVDVGPRFEIEVVGADLDALVEAGPLARLVAERYDEALGLAASEALKTHLQAQGHYRARVALVDERSNGERRVRLEVDPGPVFTLASVEFAGNEAIAEARLRPLLQTAPRRAFGGGSGRLVDAWLADDLANLRSFYALEGYAQAEVGPAIIEEAGGGVLELRIPVREGSRRLVASLDLAGAVEVAPGAVLAGLPLAVGGPYHANLLAATVDELRARYEERGYNSVQVDAEVAWGEDDGRAAVLLVVLEGPRSVVDRVIVRGYQRTDPQLIRIASGLEPGEPVNRRRLLAAQRALYGLGIFSRAEVSLVPGTPYAAGRDILVRVEEGRRRRVSYGAGFDSEDGVRGLAGYAHGNLFGRAVYARTDLRASQRDWQARLLVEQPYVWRRNLPLTYSLFGIEEEEESFDSLRYGVQVGLERTRARWRLGLLASWEWVELDLLEPIEPLDVARVLQQQRIASLTPSVLLDHRDDVVEPTTGWSLNALAQFASPVLGADADFVELFGQQTGLLGLGRRGVLAATLRLGAIEPGGDAVLTDLPRVVTPSELVPISERFFAGGSASHRAYEIDGLGIVGETLLLCPSEGQRVETPEGGSRPATCADPVAPGDAGRLLPVGGIGLLLVNLDYRFPIVGDFGGTLFADAGNVWADWRDVDPGEAKVGVGVGLRYRTPVGPVRAEIAWKLDREPLEDPFEVFLSFGYPF